MHSNLPAVSPCCEVPVQDLLLCFPARMTGDPVPQCGSSMFKKKIHVAFPIDVTSEYFKRIFQNAKIWNPLDSEVFWHLAVGSSTWVWKLKVSAKV